MKHKHYDCIVAWAEGKQIEIKDVDGIWTKCESPTWMPHCEYRIKIEPVIEVKYFVNCGFNEICYKEVAPQDGKWHLKITYQDGKAIKAEVAE